MKGFGETGWKIIRNIAGFRRLNFRPVRMKDANYTI